MKKNVVDMLDGSIVKGLLSLTMPIMIMNVAQSLFNIVDLIVLGNLVDDSAVGWVLSIITLLIAYFPAMRKLEKSAELA